jgi:hypothetical protein
MMIEVQEHFHKVSGDLEANLVQEVSRNSSAGH